MKDETATRMTPEKWAFSLTNILNIVTGPEHFPIDVKEVAKEYSAKVFPDDPITLIKGASLGNFDGALQKAPAHKKGWGIIYNSNISSLGRTNFTLAHELGHYLNHRSEYPDGIQCDADSVVRWDSEYGRVETEANVFAANLLMPLDDYRRNIPPKIKPTVEDISNCASRYGVSLIAATLRWIQYTERRSVMVVSRDGYILWARSSKSAWKSGAFFRTKSLTVPIPAQSLAALRDRGAIDKGPTHFDPGVWFAREGCDELGFMSDQYDFTLSLLHLGAAPYQFDDAEETEPDLLDVIASHSRRDPP